MSDIKEDIIEVASENMQRVGIRSLSIDDICRMVGISKKTFYVHFETKEDLVEALLKHHEQIICERVMEMIEKQTIEETLTNCFAIVYQTKRIMQPPAFVYDMQKYYPQRFEAYKESILKNTQTFAARFLEKGIAEGFFREDLNVALTARLFAILHQGILSTLSASDTDKERSLSELTQYGFGLLLRGIVSAEGGPRMRKLSEEVAQKMSVIEK
ncbi:MAG: TetR/AcrR family transcriptional regulator [Paludibacteraceae bacterium]